MPSPRSYRGEWPAVVLADWNDADAAVSRSLTRTQTAILSRTEVGSGEAGSRVRFELLSVRDEEIWLEIEALEAWPTEVGPGKMALRAGSLFPGSEALQRDVAGEVAHHLRALAGRDLAPAD